MLNFKILNFDDVNVENKSKNVENENVKIDEILTNVFDSMIRNLRIDVRILEKNRCDKEINIVSISLLND